MKKTSETHNPGLLPHFSRIFPAGLLTHMSLGIVILELFVLTALTVGLFFTYRGFIQTKKERQQEVTLLIKWERALSKHPSYPKAYYNAALHAARLGDTQKALTYLQKALVLDSSYEAAKQLKSKLGE